MAKKASRSQPLKTKRATASKTTRPRTTTDRLLPERNEIIVRMYRQGLGDCFLLALPAGRSATKYLLVDCGVHKRQTDGPARLAQVLKSLVASTGSHIDVVVATHEHADHLSGFVQKGSPFLTNEVTIGEVWLAWTEKLGDQQADTLRRKRGAAQRLIDKAVEEARNRAGRGLDGPGFANRLEGLTDFDQPPDDSVDADAVQKCVDDLKDSSVLCTDTAAAGGPVAMAKRSAKKTKPSSNELALRLLALTVGDNRTKHCEPGKVRVVEDVKNFRAYVLGPPRSDLLEKEKPSKIRGAKEGDPGGIYKEVYLTASGINRALALNPRFALEDAAGGAPLSEDWRYPFATRYQRRYNLETGPEDASGKPAAADEFKWNDKGAPLPPESTMSLVRDIYLDPGGTWRRIDGDWLTAAEALALDLASDTNNTSLAFAFEWGPPGKGRVLLFAADAQVGNWLSWRDQSYGEPGEKMKIDQLLDRVLLYKVGHHGSHNATVRRDPRDLSSPDPNGAPFGLELMNDIIAMIPVDHDAVRKNMPDPWLMPHEPLYRRLRDKARRRVMRSDQELAPLNSAREEGDLVPPTPKWTAVPGLPNARWRASKEEFDTGTKGPLYYDVAIALPS
jgi:Metallo-beta-lactamase superfamily